MKPNFLKVLRTLILGNLILLTACSKKDVNEPIPPPGPTPPQSRSVQWTMDNLPGEPQDAVSNLFALVTVVNEQNEPVLTNRKLAISFNGKFRTPDLELPAGNFKVISFILVDGSGVAKFATPRANSAKAGEVSTPLIVSFMLPQPVVLGVAMEVIRIQAGDSPESFGYPAGSFNNIGQNPPGDGSSLLKVNLRIAITIGEILYDSIPATVLYTYWDENQQAYAKYITLVAGTNEVQLARNASRHHFRMTKWGVDYERNLLKAELQEGSLYTLGGAMQAKKLKSELTYKLVDGTYKPDTKTVFNYQADGRLAEIQYFLRRQDNSPYLARREAFQYSNDQLQKINWYDEFNSYSGNTSFAYNSAGKVSRIVEDANTGVQTIASVNHHYSSATRLTEMNFNLTYSHNSISMNYYQRYQQGNLISDNSNTTNQSTETGQYGYDHNINPYAHMGWLNLFLSNGSKNNLISQQKTYYGNYPVAVAYSYSYNYDAEGYPVELVKKFKSYLTGQHLFTTKTVFNY